MIILAIDPGKSKCGVAILSDSHCLFRKIFKSTSFKKNIDILLEKYNYDCIVIGNGTYSEYFKKMFDNRFKIEMIDETNTTLEGRKLYFAYNPPKGLKRFLPSGLLFPPVDIDDYVAEVIGKKYLEKKA